MFKALSRSVIQVSKVFDQPIVKVACVGGGPGSDILGIAKFIETHEIANVALDITVLDKTAEWSVVRTALVNTVGGIKITQKNQTLDMTTLDAWTDDWTFLDSDLFTFSFSLSEVWCYNQKKSVSGFIDKIISGSKKGALFVYLDNGGADFTPLMEAEFSLRADLKTVATLDDPEMRMSAAEQRDVIENAYSQLFGGERVKMKGNVAIRVWKKK